MANQISKRINTSQNPDLFELIFDAERKIKTAEADQLQRWFLQGNSQGLKGWNCPFIGSERKKVKLLQIFRVNNPAHCVKRFKAIKEADKTAAKSKVHVSMRRSAPYHPSTSLYQWRGIKCYRFVAFSLFQSDCASEVNKQFAKPGDVGPHDPPTSHGNAQVQRWPDQRSPSSFYHSSAYCSHRRVVTTAPGDYVGQCGRKVFTTNVLSTARLYTMPDDMNLCDVFLMETLPGRQATRCFTDPPVTKLLKHHSLLEHDSEADGPTQTVYFDPNRVRPAYVFRFWWQEHGN